ncbi:MAG: RecB-family nuclease [Promethearchaeota archaeon]
MTLNNLFFILHAPESGKIIKEFTKIVILGYDLNNLVLSRVMGSATSGIEQASKDCFKNEKNLLIVKDLEDFIEVVSPDIIYLFPPVKYAGEVLNLEQLIEKIENKEKIVFVFGGGKVSGLTKKELSKGANVKVCEHDIGPLGTVAILIHEILKRVNTLP